MLFLRNKRKLKRRKLSFFLLFIFRLFYFFMLLNFNYFNLWIIFQWTNRYFLHYLRFYYFFIWSKLKFIRRKLLIWVCLRDRKTFFFLFSKCIPVIRHRRFYLLGISEFFHHIYDAKTLKSSLWCISLLRIVFTVFLSNWFIGFWSEFYLILNERFFL